MAKKTIAAPTKDRTGFLGATDIAAILGLSPWRTPWEVWAEKTKRIEPAEAGEAAEAGTMLEPVVLRMAEQTLGPIRPGGTASIPGTPIQCHPDGITQDDQPVEAKTSGILGPIYGQWGEPETDQIPEYYLVQAHVQIAAMRAQQCWVPALLGGLGLRLYTVPQHALLEEEIIERACRWWEEHVVQDRPPEQTTPPPLEVLRRLRRQPGKVITLDRTDLIQAYEAASLAAKEAEERKKLAQAALIAAMEDAEEALLPDGRRVVHRKQFRKGYTVPDGYSMFFRILKS